MSENLEFNKNKEQHISIQKIEESFKEPIQIENPYVNKRWGINNEDSIKQIASWYFAHHPEYFTNSFRFQFG